jgi:hypothetical protein
MEGVLPVAENLQWVLVPSSISEIHIRIATVYDSSLCSTSAHKIVSRYLSVKGTYKDGFHTVVSDIPSQIYDDEFIRLIKRLLLHMSYP